MKKVFVVLCIVVVGLLGLNMLPERAATADSEFMIGDLSKLAQQLNVEPGDDGKYTLASILESLCLKIDEVDERLSTLESAVATTTKDINTHISNLETKIANGSSFSTWSELQSRVDALETWATDMKWTEEELIGKVNELIDWANNLRWTNTDAQWIKDRLGWVENRLEQIERDLSTTLGVDLSYRLQQLEWELNSLRNDLNNLRWQIGN